MQLSATSLNWLQQGQSLLHFPRSKSKDLREGESNIYRYQDQHLRAVGRTSTAGELRSVATGPCSGWEFRSRLLFHGSLPFLLFY